MRYGARGVSVSLLLEFPGSWLDLEDDSALVLEAADRLLAVELVPVIAHPERSTGLQADFGIARALVERGCLLCPNGDSALGDNGPVAEQVFWRLVDEGLVALVASDGHRRIGRRGSIRRTVCLSNATDRRRSRCCSTGPPYPGSGNSGGRSET
jgi:tyrosine-protein phosphatase YwqE